MNTLQGNRNIVKKIYFSIIFHLIQEKGIIWTIKRIMVRLFKECFWLILLPISIFMHLLGFRRILFRIEHIGHLSAEFDSFMKESKLGLLENKKYYFFVLAPKKIVANNYLIKYWEKDFYFFKNRFICMFLSVLTRRYFLRYDVSRYVSTFFGAQDIYLINRLWEGKPPILILNDEDQLWGKSQFEKLGIPANRWFVCIHAREGGFLPHNEIIQSHRNVSISNFKLAINEIIKRGGMVVRMGDPSMVPISKMEGVIDYAHHALKSERLDVILCAKAKFFLGCTSGLAFVSMIFGVPIAHTNMVPFQALGVCVDDMSIPKFLWDNKSQRFLNFKEIMKSEIGGYYFTQQYTKAGISCVENTPEDILLLACEMMDRIDKTFEENEEDRSLHAKYLSYFPEGNYSYGAVSKICISFLKKYQYLME